MKILTGTHCGGYASHMSEVRELRVKVVPKKLAKDYILKNHYMGTFPNSVVSFGIFKNRVLNGVISFGYSLSTLNKAASIIPDIKKDECLEMQRMFLSDNLGHNAESKSLNTCLKLIKKNTGVRVVITHSGGCKNDCGIVYQASGWFYYGKKKCDDFYLTDKGQYKNIVAALRFGRVKDRTKKTPQEIGEGLFGGGKMIKSFRYLYGFPIDKGLRPTMESGALPYPKDSQHFRKNQVWVS